MRDRYLRGALGFVGVAVAGYGVLRLIQQQRSALPNIAKWLIGSVVVHDLIIAPAVIGIGWLVARYVPPRAAVFVQVGLITAGLVGAVAVFDIRRQHKYSSRSLTLLQQNYLLNSAILAAIILAVTVSCYLISRRLRRGQLDPGR